MEKESVFDVTQPTDFQASVESSDCALQTDTKVTLKAASAGGVSSRRRSIVGV